MLLLSPFRTVFIHNSFYGNSEKKIYSSRGRYKNYSNWERQSFEVYVIFSWCSQWLKTSFLQCFLNLATTTNNQTSWIVFDTRFSLLNLTFLRERYFDFLNLCQGDVFTFQSFKSPGRHEKKQVLLYGFIRCYLIQN